ncbi:hypothetical protein AVEN_155143-1, partial [Araneus ventricosus]
LSFSITKHSVYGAYVKSERMKKQTRSTESRSVGDMISFVVKLMKALPVVFKALFPRRILRGEKRGRGMGLCRK